MRRGEQETNRELKTAHYCLQLGLVLNSRSIFPALLEDEVGLVLGQGLYVHQIVQVFFVVGAAGGELGDEGLALEIGRFYCSRGGDPLYA